MEWGGDTYGGFLSPLPLMPKGFDNFMQSTSETRKWAQQARAMKQVQRIELAGVECAMGMVRNKDGQYKLVMGVGHKRTSTFYPDQLAALEAIQEFFEEMYGEDLE